MPKCTLRLAVQLSSTSFQRDLYSGTSLSNLSCSFIHVLFDNKVLTPYTYIISYLMHLVKTSWTYSTPFLDDTCCKKQFFFQPCTLNVFLFFSCISWCVFKLIINNTLSFVKPSLIHVC